MALGYYFKEILRGKDLYRMLMNKECAAFTLFGSVLDVGSGTAPASYRRFFRQRANLEIRSVDAAFSDGRRIDLERDALPTADASTDAVLAFNVFEHLYHHEHLMREAARVLTPEGQLIGAVPFLVGYHPDPHDYWRYTRESLEARFKEAGFRDVVIRTIGRGPCSAAFAQMEFLVPRILKFLILPCAFLCDRVIFAVKPSLRRDKFALGFFFTAKQ